MVERNPALTDAPELVNRDPYGEGWMVVITPSDAAEVEGLLEPGAYRELTETEGGAWCVEALSCNEGSGEPPLRTWTNLHLPLTFR